MIVPVPSGHRRFMLRIGLRVLEPMELIVRASDASKPHTFYFRRKVSFPPEMFKNGSSRRQILLKMPVSPKNLDVEIFDREAPGDRRFKITAFRPEPLPASKVWATPAMHDFISFAERFAQRAGYIAPGFYPSDNDEFLIQYLPRIRDQFGEVMITPARTHRMTGRIQVSQDLFRNYTVPIRLFILLHERQHFTQPTREEIPADLGALKQYLDLGYPTIEAVYAATKVFGQHPGTAGPLQVERTRYIMDFIDRYRKTTLAA